MVASVPILVTKLYIPQPPPKVVSRARLIERLNGGLSAGCKLTLVSAPAGFGKTTLVSESPRCEQIIERCSRMMSTHTAAILL